MVHVILAFVSSLSLLFLLYLWYIRCVRYVSVSQSETIHTEHKMMIHFAVTSQQFRINFIPAQFNRNSAANYTDDNAFTLRLI